MLDDVRFTLAAVAKRAYAPELTHFRIKDERITGFNGQLSLSSSIGIDVDARPNAKKFLAAISACEGPISLHMTAAGRLAVRAGRFKAYVECLEDDGSYASQPEGEEITLGPDFFVGVEALAPLMAVDASRPWAMGIKVRQESMYATNNVMAAQFWHGNPFPHDVVIPASAVSELLRIGEAPSKVQVTPHSVSFWFGEKRWLKTSLLDGGSWPLEKVEAALDMRAPNNAQELPEGFAEALDSIKPFLNDDQTVYLHPDGISTSRTEGEGAWVTLPLSLPDSAPLQAYKHTQLVLLSQVATGVDWGPYPLPSPFVRKGLALRGLIIGQRLPG